MLIAFEGPPGTGKTYAADKLSGGRALHYAGEATYQEARQVAATDKGITQCFDQVGWISHLAHNLALVTPRFDPDISSQVFAMPDTHLVFKLHKKDHGPANQLTKTYTSLAHSLMAMNEDSEYALFKSVTIMRVSEDPERPMQQEVVEFSSPLHPWWGTKQTKLVHDDLSLFDLLAIEEANR